MSLISDAIAGVLQAVFGKSELEKAYAEIADLKVALSASQKTGEGLQNMVEELRARNDVLRKANEELAKKVPPASLADISERLSDGSI